MIVFYCRDIEGDRVYLPEEEARHLLQVLRRQRGDAVRLTDGKGFWYEGIIEEAGKKNCVLRIESRWGEPARRPYRVHLAVAPTKSMDRYEWFLEKAAEIGVDRITPIWCQHGERAHLRLERLEKILQSAMKQSLQPFLVQLDEPISLKVLIEQQQDADTGRFIAYVDPTTQSPHLVEACSPGQDVIVLIGPEGDFSTEEVAFCLQAGFKQVSLGLNRLRTETAAVVAAHAIALRNDISI